MSDDDHPESTYNRREHAGKQYQPTPLYAVTLLVLFVACVVALVHFVSPLSVSGTPVTSPTSTTTTMSVTTTTLAPAMVHVQVANGTGVHGLAGTTSNLLVAHGWDALLPTNCAARDTTVVYYRPGFKWAAAKIAITIGAPASSLHAIGTAKPLPNDAGDDVIVLLGDNSVPS